MAETTLSPTVVPKPKLKKYKALVRHSPITGRDFTVEAANEAGAVKRIRADYPTVRVEDVTLEEVL